MLRLAAALLALAAAAGLLGALAGPTVRDAAPGDAAGAACRGGIVSVF
jgi:hypothetical protein